MKRLTFVVSALVVGLAGSARADVPLECRNMWENQPADIDGPVLSIQDNGAGHGLDSHYRIVVRDHFTGCRVADTTDQVCKVGQHAAIVGGKMGFWKGDIRDTDTDYDYIGRHQWTCGSSVP